jgi:hypothetical protein
MPDESIVPHQVIDSKGRAVSSDLGQTEFDYDTCREPVAREDE